MNRWRTIAALALAAALPAAAETKHDFYLCVTLSGQGQVMGTSRVPVRSGLYRSEDRANFEHIGFSHIRMFGLAPDPREPDTLWLTTLEGVVRARDGGRTWRIMTGWDMTEGKGIAFDPNAPDHLFAGLPDGIAFSPDRGRTWVRRQAGIQRAYTHPILVDRTRAGRVLAGTEQGLFVTDDAGLTWRRALATEKTVYDIRQSPHDPRAFFAVTSSDGAWRSADGGETWTPVPGVAKEATLHNVEYDRNDPRRIAVAGWGLGVRVSDDGGATWSERNGGLPRKDVWRVALDPDRPGRMFTAPHLKPLHMSEDHGRTWRPVAFEQTIAFDMVFVPRRTKS